MVALRSTAVISLGSEDALVLNAGSGVVLTPQEDGSITISVVPSKAKVYEPLVVEGFNNNIAYAEDEPKTSNFVTASNGDILMAWGGEYATQ